MMDPSESSDAELQVLAHHWRREALRGDRHARGQEHLYEVELRRRMGSVGSVSCASGQRLVHPRQSQAALYVLRIESPAASRPFGSYR